jgi:WD40 repeat protein/tetratricopeptide (TPR) repeat protein
MNWPVDSASASPEVSESSPSQADAGQRYDVFISYSRKDTAFVGTLEKALEGYKAPASLPLERRRLVVFRDAQDLTGPEYGVSIQASLRRSKRLLVICSPNASRSAYVDQEIEWFLQTHAGADVISLLLDGAPNNEVPADDPRRAFPAQLCKALAMPLAVDYRSFDAGRHKPAKPPYEGPWYTLLANIYGIDRSTIEERDRQRQRRERRIAVGVTAAVMLSLAGAAVFSWMQMRRAEEQRDVAVRGFSRYLAMESEKSIALQPERALLLATESARTTQDLDKAVTYEAELALRRALATSAGTRLGTGVGDTAYSADSRWLASIDDSGTVSVRDLKAPGRRPQAVTLPDTQRGRIRFGPAHGLAVRTSDRTRLALLDARDLSRAPRWLAATHGTIRDFEFSGDGKSLLMFDDGPDVQVADLDRPDGPVALQGHVLAKALDDMRGSQSAALSSSGRWVASSGYDKAFLLWDRKSGETSPRRLLEGFNLGSPVFSPDERWLLVRTSSLTYPSVDDDVLWYLGGDAPQRVPMNRTPAAQGMPEARVSSGSRYLAREFVPGDRLLLASSSGTELWKLSPAGARLERKLPEEIFAGGGDGRHFATARSSGGQHPTFEISLWNLDAAEPEARVEVEGSLQTLQYSVSGQRLAALVNEGELWLWKLDEEDFADRPRRFAGALGNQLVMSPNGETAVVGNSYVDARLWPLENPSLDPVRLANVDAAELKERKESGGSKSESSGKPIFGMQQMLAFDAVGQRLAVPLEEGAFAVLNLDQPNRALAPIRLDQEHVSALAFSRDGKIVAVADDKLNIRLLRTDDLQKPFAQLRVPSDEGSESSISALAISHSGKWLAAGGAFGTVAVWDLVKPAAPPLIFENHEGWITVVQFSADDSQLVIGGDDGKASVVSMGDPKPARMLEGHDGYVNAAFAPDGESVVTIGKDATIRIWSLSNVTAPPRILRGHSGDITTFVMAPKEPKLVTVSDDLTLRVWNLFDANAPVQVVPLRAPLGVLAMSQDGQRLAASDRRGTINLWRMDALDANPMTLPVAAALGEGAADTYALRFSPDDRWLAALMPGEGQLWRMRPEELVQFACDASGRNFDPEEWEAYFVDQPYRFTCAQWGLGPNYLKFASTEAERGSFEHAGRLFSRAKALVPALSFDPALEVMRIGEKSFLERGRELARRGERAEALAVLDRVRAVNPASKFDPGQEIERIERADKVLKDADRHAELGQLERAAAIYREAALLDPGRAFDPVLTARATYAPVVRREAEQLAQQGKLDEAIARFETAMELLPKVISSTPEDTARSIWGFELKNRADHLADEGNLEPSIALYRQALEVYPPMKIDARAEANKRVAAHYFEQSFSSADPVEGIRLFRKARALDASVSINGYSANELCWRAVAEGLAKRAMEICDAAVTSDAKNWAARDSRGVARVLAGNVPGGIEDLQVFVRESGRDDVIPKRSRWIRALKAGWRPKTLAEMEAR